MNYTENYHLPQWDETDRILRTDFNQMCADIEEGMSRAQSSADEAAALPYAAGSYVGNGETIRDIIVGFRPRFVLICQNQMTHRDEYHGQGLAMAGETVSSTHIFMVDNGFRLDLTNTDNPFPKVNVSGTAYDYIAFR